MVTGESRSGEQLFSGLPVVVIGGGPVGLSLAGDLGWRGIPCLLIEKTDGSIHQPRMDGVNVRTMEFCRRWQITHEVRNCGYPGNYPQDMVYLTSFGGYELGRESFLTPSGGAEELRLGASPETRYRCPQNLFDPILRRFAGSFPTVTLRYQCRFVGFEETPNGLRVIVEDLQTGSTQRIDASYLVGCDGASSPVRDQVGIRMEGRGSLTYTTNVIFRCADLQGLHNKLLGYRHLFIGPEGTWASMVAINGRDEWRFSIIGTSERKDLSDAEIKAAIDRALGVNCAYEILSCVPWVRRELVANRYGAGRVFLAGDSAHVMSPTGGFGMNTGIADAVDLSWKLAATLRGWGGARLLPSYESERRPVAVRAVREASGNLARTLSPGSNPSLLDETFEGALVRYEVGRRFSATLLREWYKLGVDLGYTYSNSPICWSDGLDEKGASARSLISAGVAHLADGTRVTPSLLREWHKLCVHEAEGYPTRGMDGDLPAHEVMVYRQSAAPGARAPHVWLGDGRSTLDCFGAGLTLIRIGTSAPDVAPCRRAASARGVPLEVVECNQPDVEAAYAAALCLVRPDGHVAWRGTDWPVEGIDALLDRVTGGTTPLRTDNT
jgi:2-polyprenyl-6-methoxyphenol hydroxylase-like FAD-dependent oxidoreductase